MLLRALEIREATLGPQHPFTAQLAFKLAELFSSTNRQEEALSYYRRALPVQEKALGIDADTTLSCRKSLVQLLDRKRLYKEALPLIRQNVETIEKKLGPEHRELAYHLGKLAGTLRDLHRYPEAESAYRRQLAVEEKCYGPEDAMLAATLAMTAQTLRDMERWKEAVPLLRREVAIHEKNLGADHETVATDLRVLAGYLSKIGEAREAEQLLQRSLTILAKAKGPEHEQVGTVLKQFADLLSEQQRPQEAEKLYLRAIQICKKTLGAGHSFTKETVENYEKLKRTMGERPDAEPAARKVLRLNGVAWNEPTAIAFLKQQLANQPAAKFSATAAATLSRQLQCNSLALAMAAAYISSEATSLAAYSELWAQESQHLDRQPRLPADQAKDDPVVTTTWNVSEKRLTPVARATLALMAWLSPEELPLSLFTEQSRHIFAMAKSFASLPAGKPDPSVEQALQELENKSLIIQEPLNLFCPPLLQATLRAKYGDDSLARATAWVQASVAKDPATPKMRPREFWEPVRTYVATLLEFQRLHGDQAGDPQITRSLLKDYAEFLQYKAQYAEARPLLTEAESLLRRALSLVQQSHPPDQVEHLSCLDNLAACCNEPSATQKQRPCTARRWKFVSTCWGDSISMWR